MGPLLEGHRISIHTVILTKVRDELELLGKSLLCIHDILPHHLLCVCVGGWGVGVGGWVRGQLCDASSAHSSLPEFQDLTHIARLVGQVLYPLKQTWFRGCEVKEEKGKACWEISNSEFKHLLCLWEGNLEGQTWW